MGRSITGAARRVFAIRLPEPYGTYLERNCGNDAKKTAIFEASMGRLNHISLVGFVRAKKRIRGPFTGKLTVVPSDKWYLKLIQKADELETTPGTVGRVVLCLFLEELAAQERAASTE